MTECSREAAEMREEPYRKQRDYTRAETDRRLYIGHRVYEPYCEELRFLQVTSSDQI